MAATSDITERAQLALDNLFTEVARDYALPSGDIEAFDAVALDNMRDKLAAILERYVENNRKNVAAL